MVKGVCWKEFELKWSDLVSGQRVQFRNLKDRSVSKSWLYMQGLSRSGLINHVKNDAMDRVIGMRYICWERGSERDSTMSVPDLLHSLTY
jgi:hypothetical protein